MPRKKPATSNTALNLDRLEALALALGEYSLTETDEEHALACFTLSRGVPSLVARVRELEQLVTHLESLKVPPAAAKPVTKEAPKPDKPEKAA